MDFLAKVVLNLLRSLFLFNRATKKIPIHAPKPFVVNKSRIIAFEVSNPKRRIMRPVWLIGVLNQPQSAGSSRHNPRRFHLGFIVKTDYALRAENWNIAVVHL